MPRNSQLEKQKPTPEIKQRFDLLGTVMFHCCKALRSLEYAKDNLQRAGVYVTDPAMTHTPFEALDGIEQAMRQQKVAHQYAYDLRESICKQYIIE